MLAQMGWGLGGICSNECECRCCCNCKCPGTRAVALNTASGALKGGGDSGGNVIATIPQDPEPIEP